jgi:ferrous iron transport protein B
MTPFMSCGAKLPVWVLFAAAFFPQNPGRLVFYIYITGIVLGIVTGLILKHTLFQGEPTHFIMELPPYHLPRARHIFLHTWERLKIFIWRAGKFIVPMVLVLGILNTVGTDGSIGNEDKKESLLSVVGKSITPVFEPIGVEKDNWPASVSIFTGLFAKESVIGTMKGLYGQDDAGVAEPEDEEYSLVGGLKEAFVSIPENLSGVWSGLIDPLGFAGAEEEAHDGSEDENKSTIDSLKRHFPKGVHQMYSFLLFVLLYIPCLAATGVVFREIGKLYGTIFVGYLTLLGWSVATIYHAVMVSGSGLWLIIGTSILVFMFGGFWLYGKRHRVDMI